MSRPTRVATPSKKGRGSSSKNNASSSPSSSSFNTNSSHRVLGAHSASSLLERKQSYSNYDDPKRMLDLCSDELLSTAILRDPRDQSYSKEMPTNPPDHHIIAPFPNPNPLVKSRKPLYVRPRIFIQMISNVESQTFSANLFISATDADHNQTSSTAAFQARYEDVDAQKLLKPERLPPWHVNLLNAEHPVNLYREKNLPSIRYFPRGFYNGDGRQQIAPHFFERQQVSGIFKSEFHLHCFPFDLQILKIELSLDCPIYIAQFDKLWLAANRKIVGMGKDGKPKLEHQINVDAACESALHMTEWEAKPEDLFYKLDKYTNIDDFTNTATACNGYSRITIVIPISRIHTHYGFIIFLPLALIDLSSIFAFTAIAEDSLTLIATLMLAVFSLKLAFASIIPRLSYLSTMDKLFVWSYGYLFMCMVVLVLRKEKFVIRIAIEFFKLFGEWEKKYMSIFIAKVVSFGALYIILRLAIKNTFVYNSKPSNNDERQSAIKKEKKRYYYTSCLRGLFLGIISWDYFGDIFGFSRISEYYNVLAGFAYENSIPCYYSCIVCLYTLYFFRLKSSNLSMQSIQDKAAGLTQTAWVWIENQFFRLLRLHLNSFIFNMIHTYELFLAISPFIPRALECTSSDKFSAWINSVGFVTIGAEYLKSFLVIAFMYSICGLFRRRFDPTQDVIKDGDLYLDSSEIVLNLDSYTKKTIVNKSFPFSFSGAFEWVSCFLKKLFLHHTKEIFLGSLWILAIETIVLSKFNLRAHICDFMTSEQLIEVVVHKNENSVAYGSYDLVNKKILIDGVNACDFLYLGAFFKVFSLSIILSIHHIFKDCFEHQAAFAKELQAYKESANKELDAIFSPYLPKKQ